MPSFWRKEYGLGTAPDLNQIETLRLILKAKLNETSTASNNSQLAEQLKHVWSQISP